MSALTTAAPARSKAPAPPARGMPAGLLSQVQEAPEIDLDRTEFATSWASCHAGERMPPPAVRSHTGAGTASAARYVTGRGLDFSPRGGGILQRKCACGGNAPGGGECEECAKKKLQRKLAIGSTTDPLEREADQIAEQVLSGPASRIAGRSPVRVQRSTGSAEASAATAPASVERVLASPGQPLRKELREDMEERFGHDFSQVRVHSDHAAGESARDVRAEAYTAGKHVVFGASRYAPDTAHGRILLAHELAHVVQQRGRTEPDSLQRFPDLSLGDIFVSGLEGLASNFAGPAAGELVKLHKQPIVDILASVAESPQHVTEFFQDEVWKAIKDHWPEIIAVTAGLITAQIAVAVLAALPDPTLLTKVIAVILQIAIIAIIGYFAAVELKGVYEEGRKWFSTAANAKGKSSQVSEASRSFVRMVWHIVMAVLAVAGVRASVRGIKVPGRTPRPAETPDTKLPLEPAKPSEPVKPSAPRKETVEEYVARGGEIKRPPKPGEPERGRGAAPKSEPPLPEGFEDIFELPGISERKTLGTKSQSKATEAGTFAHKHFKSLEELLQAFEKDARNYVDGYPKGKNVKAEFKIEHPDYPRGRKPSVDLVDWDSGMIFEIKPRTKEWIAKGRVQAQQYAEWMNKYHARGGNRRWVVGGVLTYDQAALLRWLIAKGYLPKK